MINAYVPGVKLVENEWKGRVSKFMMKKNVPVDKHAYENVESK